MTTATKTQIAVFSMNDLVGVCDTEAQAEVLRDTVSCGFNKEYKRTFESIEAAVTFFNVPAEWALQKGRKKFGKMSGGTFYGYDILETGEAVVWSDF